MAKIHLDVPFVSQLEYGDPTSPMNDWTGCWYASACMVAYYFEAGPRLGVPEKYDAVDGHSGMSPDEYPTLMANEHLAMEPLPDNEVWTGDKLLDLLRKYGPLSFGWIKDAPDGSEYGHRSVLIGYDSDGEMLTFHDPELAPNSRMTVEVFNSRFNWGNPYGMLRREGPGIYTRSG